MWLLVFGVYAASLWFERFGIRSARHGTDVGSYRLWASAIGHGQLPYRNFYFAYPPGSLVPMLAAQPFSDYARAFKTVMAVAGAGTLVVAATALREPARRSLWPLLVIAVSPLVVGSVFVNRFDLWPALLMALALLLLVRQRPEAAFAFLAMGTVTKIFPAAALPAAAVWVWRTHGSRKLKQASIVFAVTGLLVILPFAIIGPGGLRYSFTVQLTRHLQTESLGGAILLAAARSGLYHPTIATGNPGSLDLFGALPDVAGAVEPRHRGRAPRLWRLAAHAGAAGRRPADRRHRRCRMHLCRVRKGALTPVRALARPTRAARAAPAGTRPERGSCSSCSRSRKSSSTTTTANCKRWAPSSGPCSRGTFSSSSSRRSC